MKKSALVLVSLMLFTVFAFAADIAMTPVESSLIEKVGYDAESQTLAIQMHNSSDTYLYQGVSSAIYESFLAAESKGSFYVKNIKGQFENTRK